MSVPRPPLKVALAQSVSVLPRGHGLAYEPKFDGHRMVIFKVGGTVLLQARSGRIVTASFPDLADAARRLPEGTVLDGEVVVWKEGRTDFASVQKRAAATAGRAPALAHRLPASYAAFDLLAEGGEDLRPSAYEKRRARLVALLGPLGPPLQPVPMTLDADEAATWFETLPAIGVEGLVVKRLDQTYRGGTRAWRKLRHTSARDAAVVGFTGPRTRPTALVLVLPDDDTPVVSSPLSPALRAQATAAFTTPAGAHTGTATAVGVGEVEYRRVETGLTAEVEQGTTRHAVTTVLRLRLPTDKN
ncbi:ATP dependent DNA ligase-like protein [Streptomyces sp. SLBN-118]|uniref:ATP-dependent DNA ligase n=1 Tax=Streptomyces sp. SLBN-118 TaxID=2768454 RepID=UPI00116EB18A|nr:ATP-dependent DNA ligase [Streptomyces sp. SLBN-118]TQK51874.1 ATP dependent DNA ligase-like protein [Streptomyces sp. SLBN-118]